MSNQFFKDLYKTTDPIDEPVNDTNDQVQKDDPFEEKIPLAAAQIELPVKETDNQYHNPDPYTDAIPLVAAQIENVVAKPNDQIQNRNRFEDEVPMDSDVIYEEPKEENVIVIDPIDIPVSDELQGFDVPNPDLDTSNSLLDETIPTGILVGYSLINKPLENKPVPLEYSIGETPNFEIPAVKMDTPKVTLGNLEDSQLFHKRWNEIQSQFVDDPKDAVLQADVLISEIIEKIKQRFDNEHATLKNTWVQSGEISTEDLRTTLRKYHTLVDLLLV